MSRVYLSLSDRPQTGPRAETGTPGKRRRVPAVVVTLGLVSMLTDVSSESVAAILPLYLTAGLGLSVVAYGFVDGLYQGVSALVRIGGGWAADRGGRPKWVALCGYGLSCVARVAMLFATGLGAISTTVSVDRVGKGLRTAPRDAMISAAAPPDRVGEAFGVHRALDTVGAVIGPVLAFVILWAIPDGYHSVLVVSLAFAVLGVVLLALLVPDVRPGPAERAARRELRWRAVADPALARLLVVAGALGLLTVGDGFIYLALRNRDQFAVGWFPLLYVGTNVAYLALAVPAGRLADRVGRGRVLVLGHLALAAAYLCVLAPGGGTLFTLLPLALLGAFYAATDGVIAALAGRVVSPAVRASGIAAAQTVVALARLVSSVVFGLLWFAVGPQTALLLVCTALVAAIPVALVTLAPLDARPGRAR